MQQEKLKKKKKKTFLLLIENTRVPRPPIKYIASFGSVTRLESRQCN